MEKKDLTPNHTQIPNHYLDKVMPFLSGAEWKCLSYIARRTYGFQKRTDKISLTQFQKGIKTRSGEQLDYGSGIKSRTTVLKALDRLVSIGLIEKVSGRITSFKVVQKLNQSGVVQKLNQCSPKNEPKVVQKMNTQKKGKKGIQKKALLSNASVADPINSLIKLFEPVNPTYETLYKNKTQRSAIEALVKKFGEEKIRNTLIALPKIVIKKYAPQITTPLQLRDKLGSLCIFVAQNQDIKNKKGKAILR